MMCCIYTYIGSRQIDEQVDRQTDRQVNIYSSAVSVSPNLTNLTRIDVSQLNECFLDGPMDTDQIGIN